MFKADKPDSSYINIGGSPFMIDMLASSGKSIKMRSPLVFMNACRTAGSAPTYTQLSGWADKFLDAGASAFIGSLWEIRDSSAPIFAENVYGSLLSGTTLGNSVLNARKAIQEETGDPTWLAYALYGDPNATLIQGE
jgi:CHAT domain-containing protein